MNLLSTVRHSARKRTWLHPTHAFRDVDAQFSARERVVANLLLTEGRAS